MGGWELKEKKNKKGRKEINSLANANAIAIRPREMCAYVENLKFDFGGKKH